MDQELHTYLSDIKATVSGIDAKLNAVKENLETHVEKDEAKFKDLYDKAGKAEQFRSRVKGGFLTLGGLSAMLAAWVNWDRLGG